MSSALAEAAEAAGKAEEAAPAAEEAMAEPQVAAAQAAEEAARKAEEERLAAEAAEAARKAQEERLAAEAAEEAARQVVREKLAAKAAEAARKAEEEAKYKALPKMAPKKFEVQGPGLDTWEVHLTRSGAQKFGFSYKNGTSEFLRRRGTRVWSNAGSAEGLEVTEQAGAAVFIMRSMPSARNS